MRTSTGKQRAPGMRRAPSVISSPPAHPGMRRAAAVCPAGVGCRSTGPPGAARPSASLLRNRSHARAPCSGEGPLPRPRVPLAQRSAAEEFIPTFPPPTSSSAPSIMPSCEHHAIRPRLPSSSLKGSIIPSRGHHAIRARCSSSSMIASILPSHRHHAVRARCPSSSVEAYIAMPYHKIKLACAV